MMKKMISMVLAIILCFSMVVFSHASNDESVTLEEQYHTIVTDPNEIEEIIQKENVQVPDGYTLEKVEYCAYIDIETANANSNTISEKESRAGLVYYITNVKIKDDFYFVNDYDHDIFEGPAEITTKYSYTREVRKSLGVTIGNSTVEAAVGYDITDKYTKEKEFSTTVASGKVLHVYVYPVYRRTTFDIYNRWTDELVKSGAYTDKLVGIYVKQQTYSR